MADLLSDISAVVTQGATWASSVATTVVSTPIYLVFTAIPLVGLGIGLFHRLTK